MNEIFIELQKLTAEITDLKKKLADFENAQYFDNWVPRKILMDYFDYGDTQIAALLKSNELVVSEIGNRKFVKKTSILRLIENNIKTFPKKT